MNAQNYAEWSRLSGLYLANISALDRYDTYTTKLSPAGLTTVIVSDFLEDNTPVVDVQKWRTHSIYEMGPDAQRRVDLTASALETIGAVRTAAIVRTAKSNSPFDLLQNLDPSDPAALIKAMKGVKGGDLLKDLQDRVAHNFPEIAQQAGISPAPSATDPGYETREQIEHLLEQFATRHAADLQADIDRHGDPRLAPGFTVEGRQNELQQARQRMFAQENQREAIPQLQELMTKIGHLAGSAESKAASKLKKLRREFLDLLKENRARPAEDLLPEMAAFLPEVEAFRAAHPAVFQQDHIGDPAIQALAAALGSYESELARGTVELTWSNPAGLACSWANFSLTLVYPKKQVPALRALLRAVTRLQQRFPALSEEWRQELLRTFRDTYAGQMEDWELEEYDVGPDGEITDESILAHAGGANILLTAEDRTGEEIEAQTFFSVEWDEEHGFPIEWTDEPDAAAPAEEVVEEPAGEFPCGAVTLVNSGPALTAGDITRFETMFDYTLPANYRQFLRQHNGGEPQPADLVFKEDGASQQATLERFLSITGADGPYPDSSLEKGLHFLEGERCPNSLLPIANVRMAGAVKSLPPSLLALVLAGKRAGQIILVDPVGLSVFVRTIPNKAMLAMMLAQLAEQSPVVARSLEELFAKKLKAAAKAKLPAWLELIRQNDIPGFLAWIEAGGKLTEKFQEKGLLFKFTVTEYLTREASFELLQTVVARQLILPRQLRQGWEQACQRDGQRFRLLMPLLPKSLWLSILTSHTVWDDLPFLMQLLEQLAAAGHDFNTAVNEEGAPPLHLAVMAGQKEVVQWLMDHDADPKLTDNYDRDAFIWAESGPGFACLKILQGKTEDAGPTRPAAPDVPGIALLAEAAAQLPPGVGLLVSIEIKTPPVTRIEQKYPECHYTLTMDVRSPQVTVADMLSARQDYLQADAWPASLFIPILQWPELTPLWHTVAVHERDIAKAVKSRKYKPVPRPDLHEAARTALVQGFDLEEAAARGIQLRK